MGVFGLLSHCIEKGIGKEEDLFRVAKENGGIELVIDFRNFYITLIGYVSNVIRSRDSSWIAVSYLGGEYTILNKLVLFFCECLADHHVTPVFFDDGPRGSDPLQFVTKMETWKARHEASLELTDHLTMYLKNIIDIDDIGSIPMPWLAEDQVMIALKQCLSKHGGKFFTCKGEADDIMAKYLLESPKAYAIVGNDGDFCVMKDCRFIAAINFPWREMLLPRKEEELIQCLVTVYTPNEVAHSLGLYSQKELVDVAILAGNDFTKPLLSSMWTERTGLKSVVQWYRDNVIDGTLEDCEQFQSILEKTPALKDAVKFSRRFYNLEDIDRQMDRQTESQSALRRYIVDSVEKLNLPSSTLAYLEGNHWGGYLIEDKLLPSIEDWTKGLCCFAYSMCTEQTIMTVLSRSNKLELDEQKIPLKHYDWLPKAHEVQRLDDESRWLLFDKIVSYLEKPVDRLSKDDIYNGMMVHSFFNSYGKKTGFMLHAINHLMTIAYMNKYDLQTWEYVSLLSTTIRCISRTTYEGKFDPTWKKPTMACLTLGNWYQYVVKVLYKLSKILLVCDEFPEPKQVYQGRYFTSLYMTLKKDSDLKNGNVDQSVLDMMKLIIDENHIFDEDYKNEMKRNLGFIKQDDDIGNLAAPSNLPIEAHKGRIMKHINKYRVTCIEGETGSGKSTKVPQFILEDYQNQRSMINGQSRKPCIVVTQPRRLAAKTLAERVSNELGDSEVGQRVGYKIGQDHTYSENTLITYVTTGHMIQLLVHNPRKFARFTHIILDEIHERDLDADLMSLMMLLLMKEYAGPKIIIMSATLQAKLFVSYFAESKSTAASMKQHLFVGVKTPYHVKQLYIEDLMHHYGDSISLDGQRQILNLFCEFFNMSIDDLVNKKWNDNDIRNSESDESSSSSDDSDFGSDEEVSGFVKARALAVKLIEANCFTYKERSMVRRGRVSLDRYLKLSVPLIQTVSKPGESILIFLPGKKEIDDIHDRLMPYQDRNHPDWYCKITLFILHSSIPFEDQQDCFNPPPPNACHVILATNIAESSLTLPLVTVVIDFGLKRQMIYDTRKRVRCMRTWWCSQASMMQRKGRTGRVCNGVCIRIMTKVHFDDQSDFDEPQMRVSPLDKTILQVKYIGQSIAPDKKPSELLAQAVQPPKMDNISAAVKNLADIGALTAADECADVTLLGKLATMLPLDLYMCRLIFFGCLFECPCDVVVIAAAMQSEETFKLPAKKVLKNQDMFIKLQREAYYSRKNFDKNNYSEPIMFRNMYRSWLQTSSNSNMYQSNRYRSYSRLQDFPTMNDDSRRKRERFCLENALMSKRLNIMEGLVFDLINTTMGCLPKGSRNYLKLEAFLSLVPKRKEKHSPSSFRPQRYQPKSEEDDLRNMFTIKDLFSDDNLLLNTIFAASLSPRFIMGSVQKRREVTKKKGKGKVAKASENTILEMAMIDVGVDPKKSVSIPGLPDWVREDETMLNKVVKYISLMDSDRTSRQSNHRRESHGAGVISDYRIVKHGKEVFVQYHTPTIFEKSVDPRKEITFDVHYFVHYPYQFSEAPGRGEFLMELPKPNVQQVKQNDGERYIMVDVPRNPYKIDFQLLSYDGTALQQGPRVCRSICGWRNPIGFSCDLKKREHYGTAATFTKAMYGMSGWADGVSVFPYYQENLFAIILMLTFLCEQHGVGFVVDTKNVTIDKIRIFNHEINVSKTYPLSKKILELINEVRAEVSKIFINEEATRQKSIPESNLLHIYKKLIEVMSQNDSLNSRRTCSESSVQSNISEDTDRNDQNDSNNPENIGSTESKKLESKESLPNRILVNAFNVKESGKPEANSDNTPTKKKSHSNIKNMLEDIDELQIFKYLAPYDMQVFEKKYLSQFHCKKENLLKADNVESKTESESESTTDSDDEDDDSDVDFITTYSSNNPKMLRNSLKAVVNSQVKLQCVPLLVSEMWESEAIEEIVEKLNVVLTRYSREAFTQDKFVEMLKDEFVVAKVNSGDLVVCSKENVMGKELHKLLKAAEEETEREILVSVYCVLLEKSNKARKLEYLVKKMKSEIETLDIDGTGLYEKLANLMKKQGLFVIKSSPEGKESVKIKPELYSKIKETTDRAMKKKETVREMKSQEKSEEKHNSKLSVHQRTQIREMVYDQLVSTENVPIPFKNILGIGTIYEVFFSKGAAEKMNIIKEFTKIFTATKKLPDWFEVNDETVCLHSSVYEAYVHRNEDEELLESSSRSVVLSEQLQNSEENEVEDSWDHSYAFVSDDVIDLCLTVVNQDIVSKALDLAEKKNSVVRQHSDLQMGKVSSSCEKYLVYERDMIITTNSSNNQNERRTETIQDNTMNTNKLQLGSHFTNMLPSVEKMQSSCKDLQLCNRDNEFTVNHSDSSAESQKGHTFSDDKYLQENVSPSGEKYLPKCTAIDDVGPTYHLDQCDHEQELETNTDCPTNVKETSCMSINKEEALTISILELFQVCKCQKMTILNLLLNDNVQKMWQAVKKSGTVKKFTQYVSKNANLDIEIGEDGKIWIKCCSGSDSEFRENITGKEKEIEHPTSKCKDRVCNEDTSTYSCESTVSNNTPYGLSLTTAEKILVQNILDLFCVKKTSQLTRKDLGISKIQDSWKKVRKRGKYRKLWDFVKCQTEYFSVSKFMGKSTIIKVPEIHVLQHSHLQSNETLTPSMDSHLQSNETLTPSMDSHLQSNETLTPSMDSHLQSNETLTPSMDYHLQSNETLTPHYAQEESIENSINHFQRIRSAVDEFCASRKLNRVETVISKIESTFKCSAILGGKCIADGSGSTAEEAAIASLCNALTWLQDMFC